ncbi:MAG: hypothetical protein BYD32DRAFT_422685 [Podila humilis]|nr:MAG: hypothetical protein BYD32DRAFT_422685 [Podila humilis]
MLQFQNTALVFSASLVHFKAAHSEHPYLPNQHWHNTYCKSVLSFSSANIKGTRSRCNHISSINNHFKQLTPSTSPSNKNDSTTDHEVFRRYRHCSRCHCQRVYGRSSYLQKSNGKSMLQWHQRRMPHQCKALQHYPYKLRYL